MELFDYYLCYMTELLEGKRPAPEGITLTAEDEEGRTRQITEQLASMGAADFVRACAAQDGEALPESLFDGDSGMAGFEAFLKSAQQTEEPAPQPEPANEPDPDAGKHAFEVFLDCVAMDDGLVQYLIDVLKRRDWKEFYKLSQITTRMDLDPEEFLYWLGPSGGLRRRRGALLRRHHGRLSGTADERGQAGAGGGAAQRRPDHL